MRNRRSSNSVTVVTIVVRCWFVSILFVVGSLFAQTRIRDLPLKSPVVSGDYFPVDAGTGGTWKTTLADILSGVVVNSRIINCTAPLLCNGSTSMDLAGTRTLSISPFYLPLTGGVMTMTPAAGGAPLRLLTTGSTLTGGSNQGLRTSLMGLYDTRTSANDGVALNVEVLQTSHSSTIVRTGIQCSAYTEPDNGGDTSCILAVASGGGPAITAYKHYGLRPTGLTNQSASPQPALEIGSGDAGPAGLFSAGVSVWGSSLRNHAIEARMGASAGANQSDGIIIWPIDNVFDSRIALAVASPQSNAAPVNIKYQVLASGDEYHFSGLNTAAILSAAIKLTNDTNDGSAQSITFRKSRAGLSVNTNEDIGDVNWNMVNSTPAEIQGGVVRGIATDPVASSEDMDLVTYLVRNGTLAERFRIASTGNITATGSVTGSNLSGTNTGDQTITLTGDVTGSGTGSFAASLSSTYKGWTDGGTSISTTTSTDKVGIGTSSPTAPLTVSANVTAPPTPPTGALIHLINADGTAPRLSLSAFASNGSIDLIRANGTNASQTVINNGEVIGQLAGFAHDGTGITSTGRVNMQFQADGTWNSGSTPTAVRLNTTLSATTSARLVMVVDNAGHIIMSDSSAPTVSCTGTGTSPSTPTVVGTDNNFIVTINTGTGTPGSTGTCTVTFAHGTYTNTSVMVCMPVKGATAWGNGASLQLTTESTTAPVVTWTNLVGGTATALTVSTSYKFSCVNMGRG